MRQPVLRVKGPRASKVVALWTSRARRDSQASAATRLRAMLRERRPRWPETIRRQASAGEAHLQEDPFPTRLIRKGGGPSARPLRPLARVSPPLAASREARAMSPRLALGVECRAGRREPSTAPPHARRPRANYAHTRGRRPIFSQTATGPDVRGRPLICAGCSPVSRRCAGRPGSPTPCAPGFPSRDSRRRCACCCPCRFRCAPATT